MDVIYVVVAICYLWRRRSFGRLYRMCFQINNLKLNNISEFQVYIDYLTA